MPPITFSVLSKDSLSYARTGLLKTAHGEIETPAFVFAATQASVKSLSPDEFTEIGCQIAIANTYHLHLRPGEEVIEKAGGLHKFMDWSTPLATDSGGFQVLSLGAGKEHGVGKIGFLKAGERIDSNKTETFIKVTEDGVHFRSHIDGSNHFFNPEKSMQIQSELGADIIFAFDECTSPFHNYEYTKKSLERSNRWAIRSLKASDPKQAIFGIIQGGEYQDLRLEATKFISKHDFDGIAIGGSLGQSKADMIKIIRWVIPYLPLEKPRHLLGIGDVVDIFKVVPLGIDLMDCVWPTRLARRGMFFLLPESGGNLKNRFRSPIRLEKYQLDQKPLDPNCLCQGCQKFSRSYLRHLFIAQELLAYRLLTYHNVWFFTRLMERIRKSLTDGSFEALRQSWFNGVSLI